MVDEVEKQFQKLSELNDALKKSENTFELRNQIERWGIWAEKIKCQRCNKKILK